MLGYFHVGFYVILIRMGKEINDFNTVVRVDAPSRRGRQLACLINHLSLNVRNKDRHQHALGSWRRVLPDPEHSSAPLGHRPDKPRRHKRPLIVAELHQHCPAIELLNDSADLPARQALGREVCRQCHHIQERWRFIPRVTLRLHQ
jgi:hypothetical protein